MLADYRQDIDDTGSDPKSMEVSGKTPFDLADLRIRPPAQGYMKGLRNPKLINNTRLIFKVKDQCLYSL